MLACFCKTGTISNTPTAAMETMLGLPPLDIYISGEARMEAYLLKVTNNWNAQDQYGHSRITSNITNPILEKGSNSMLYLDDPLISHLKFKSLETNDLAI